MATTLKFSIFSNRVSKFESFGKTWVNWPITYFRMLGGTLYRSSSRHTRCDEEDYYISVSSVTQYLQKICKSSDRKLWRISYTNLSMNSFWKFLTSWTLLVYTQLNGFKYCYLSLISKVKLATIVEGDPKVPFSIATTPRCRGGRYSFPWIALLYPWSLL